jgi:endonuclease/exonuclease/phosphatase family metal-dependent hydrolase
VFRRVRLGRRDDSRRALRWAGPPPLLMFATVAALLVTPFVDDGGEPPAQITTAAVTTTSPRSVEPPPIRPQRVAGSRGGQATRGIAPVRPKPQVGVVSMNMFRDLSRRQAAADARRLTRSRDVDLVGWQEAEAFGPVLRGLPGWRTATFSYAGEPSELAISWRKSTFRLVAAWQREVAPGTEGRVGRVERPFGVRLVAVVTLEHRETGRRLTLIDVHLPAFTENLGRPGTWRPTVNAAQARRELQGVAAAWRDIRARWVVGTGDFNFDASADAVHHAPGGPLRALGPRAVSSYQVLGTRLPPTYPGNHRHIDYVWADRKAYAEGRIRFAGQQVVGGLNSDHNALLATLLLA